MQILMGWLMDEEQHQTVISVVGMGGSVKTTLAAKTFSNERVQRHFNCYAWITVSETYVTEDLFRSLIKELHKSTKEDIPPHLNAMNRTDLRDILVNYLESKRTWKSNHTDNPESGRDDAKLLIPATVLLLYMFNVAEMKADERLRRELQADVEEECQKLGPVDSVKVCENHPQGVVLVRLKDRKDAQKCIELMNGRWFGFLPGAHVPVVHRTHDLLRELALSISEKEKFGLVYDGRQVMEEITTSRLSFHTTSDGGEIKSGPGMSKIRSLLIFATNMSSLSFSNELSHSHKELQSCSTCAISLCIARPEIFMSLNGYEVGTKAPSNICQLQKLQCLITIESDGHTIRLIGNLTQLTTMGISNLKETDEIDLWASNEEEYLPVKAECPPLPHLQKLYLTGRLQKVVPWFSSLHSLTFLQLHWSRLEDDVLPHIEELPHLTKLQLMNAYVGEELCFRRGFVKLVKLLLRNFGSLKKIAMEKGAMPNLRDLYVGRCMELKAVPLGLENLSNLQLLNLNSVPTEIINSIRKGGADRENVQHIPEIRHVFQQSSKWFYENLS
ncbi:hypothetical protein ACLB2K_032661 [Fragaria x ananassa]